MFQQKIDAIPWYLKLMGLVSLIELKRVPHKRKKASLLDFQRICTHLWAQSTIISAQAVTKEENVSVVIQSSCKQCGVVFAFSRWGTLGDERPGTWLMGLGLTCLRYPARLLQETSAPFPPPAPTSSTVPSKVAGPLFTYTPCLLPYFIFFFICITSIPYVLLIYLVWCLSDHTRIQTLCCRRLGH